MRSGMRLLTDQRGVTLTELLITLALLVLILTATASIFSEGMKSYSRDITETGAQLDLRLTGDRLRRDIRSSQSGIYEGQKYPYSEEKKLYLLAGDSMHPFIISISFQDGTIMRQAEGKNERLLERVENVEFRIAEETSGQSPVVQMKIMYKEHPTHQMNPIIKQWNLHVMPRFSRD